MARQMQPVCKFSLHWTPTVNTNIHRSHWISLGPCVCYLFCFLHLWSSFWWKVAAFHAKGESIDLLPAFLWNFTFLLTKWRVGKKSGCKSHDSLINKWRISDMREFLAQIRNTGKVRNRQLSHTLNTYLFHETGINFVNQGYFCV